MRRHIGKTLLPLGVTAVALVVFGVRLMPIAEGDRAIFEAVGDGLVAGQRLYQDVYDNKDPLFLYAVAGQRLVGDFGGWLFEASCLGLAGWSLARLHRWLVGVTMPRQELMTGILGAMLLSGGFWGAGQPQLPASALMLLTVLFCCQGRATAAGICTALIAGFKLVCLPVTLAMAFTFLTRQGSKAYLRFGLGLITPLALIYTGMQLRGELSAYGQALTQNIFYSQGLLIQSGNIAETTASHVRTLFFSGKNNLLMLAALFTASLIMLQAASSAPQPREQLGKAGLAGLICATAITTMTGLWSGHLQLLYPTQCIALLLFIQGWKPSITWQKTLQIPSLLVITTFLSGTLDLSPTYLLKPPQIANRFEKRFSQSEEVRALRKVFPQQIPDFARLGSNGSQIPVGLDGSRLTCADFHQYGFYNNQRLDGILECVSKSPVVLVSPSFNQWGSVPTWLPREAQGLVIKQQWNRFVDRANNQLRHRFQCSQDSSGTRVCIKGTQQ